jgi:putative ABC transport system permease protein
MRDWESFVRDAFRGRQEPSEQAIEELAQHVEETWRTARAAGRTDDEALALARAQLQNAPARLPANMLAPPGRGVAGMLAAVSRDLRYSLRMLRGRPGFTAVAVVTLALGIGANTAIFSVVRALLLEPLPFKDPQRLAMLWEADAKDPARRTILSAPNYKDFSQGVQAFERTGIWEYLNFNFSGDGEAERALGLRVSASTFQMLGVAPALGRTFTPEEDAPGHDVAIISYGLWQRRFGGRAEIVGRTTRINAKPYEIVGVMPASFRFPVATVAVWTPIAFNEEDQGRNSHSFFAAVRLKQGVSFAAANAELAARARALAKQYPESNGNNTATMTPMGDHGVQELRPTLFALTGAVALVLAIACVNVANLLLAQSTARRREFGIRAALGASRSRLAAQMLTEALIIAALGGAAGVAVAVGCTRLLADLLPGTVGTVPFRDVADIHVDRVVLAFTSGLSLLTGLLFGLAPIVGLRRGSDLKASGDRGATGRMTLMQGVLVGTEVALALIVLVGAGLMVKSLMKLLDNDPGLDSSSVLVVTMSLPQPDFYGPPVRQTFCSAVTDRVGSLPGVLAVGAISHLPLTGQNAGRLLAIDGQTLPPGENAYAAYRLTCPGYFKAMGIRLLKGRDFDARDATEAPGVVIINEATANRYWPGEDPIGKRFKLGRRESSSPWMTVVGVVANTRNFGLDDGTGLRVIFRPYSQAAWPVMTIVAKTAADPAGFATGVRSALQRIDPDLPVNLTTTMTQVERASTGSRRFPMQLLGAFGAVALALAVVGVYGVVSYLASQRTREIGIRVALGARRGQVMRLIVAGAMRPVLAGVVAGAIGAVYAARLLGALLYDVTPGDPAVVVTIAGLLVAAGAAASLVPGARATRVDPITVLRAE